MNKFQKLGIILILLGFCLPLVSILFTSNHYPERGLLKNLQSMELVLRQGENKYIASLSMVYNFNRIAIPYKYILTGGILAIFVGIGIVKFSGVKDYSP